MISPGVVGRALARLTTPFDPDAYLSFLHPLWGTKLRGVVEAVTPVTAEAAAITIRPSAGWPGHVPGQFTTLGVDVRGVRHHRCYSITSAPGTRDRRGPLIEVVVQAVPGGTVSQHLVHDVRPGEVVRLSAPAGELTPDVHAGPVLFVTGGSGLTPALGVLRALDRERPAGADVVVLHHATDPGRCLHLEEMERLDRTIEGVRITTTFTRTGPRRHLDAERLEHLCPDWRERTAYVCGPEAMVATATDLWQREGLGDRLLVERHTQPRAAAAAAPLDGATVRFAASGVEVLAEGSTSLLELAERAGLPAPAGCRSGICHTCSTRLAEGCTLDLRDGRESVAGEHVQLCVSAAASDVTLDL